MKRLLRSLFIASLTLALVAYSGLSTWPPSNQMLARGDLEALEANGKLAFSGSDPGWGTSSAQLATYSDFTTYFKNSGSCGGSSSEIISSAAAQACAVLSSTISPTTDPWLTLQGAHWPTQAGTPTFTADATGSGAPGNAYNVNSTAGTATVWQSINGGATILAGTVITVGAQLKYTSQNASLSGDYTDSNCTNAASGYLTATGSATVQVMSSSGTVLSYSSASGTNYGTFSKSYTVPSGGGAYYVGVTVTEASQSGTYYHLSGGHCVSLPVSASGNGYATDITVQ